MKLFLTTLSILVLSACSKTPRCNYNGQFTKEANAGCFVVQNKKLLFVETKNGKLSLPGGGKSTGEAPQCTAEREVWEETGIEVIAKDRIITFENGFQLFECVAKAGQSLDGSNRPWRFEVSAVQWLSADEFDGQNWRFPEQTEFVKGQLIKASGSTE